MTASVVAIRPGSLVLEGRLVVPESPRALLVLLHGIPGGRTPDPTDPGYGGLADTFVEQGFAALHFDFRGIRGAPGEFSFRGWVEDAEAALTAVEADRRLSGLKRIVVGSSAGGAVGIVAASGRPDVAAVATLAAPASFEGMATGPESAIARLRNTGLLHDPAYPPDPAAWFREFSDGAAERWVGLLAPRPLLLVHGEEDDVVAYPHAERLFAAAGEPKELVRIPRGRHQLRRDPRAVEAVLDWLDRHELPPILPVRPE